MTPELQEEYEKLIQQCTPRLLRIALSILPELEEAKDVCQEVFLKLLVTPHIREKSAWLYRATMNQALNHRKKQWNRKYREEEKSQSETFSQEPGNSLTQQELRERLQNSLETLSENQKMIFLLRHEAEMAIKEIAQVLHISEGSVKKQLSRALDKLRIRLKQEEPQ
ncbi:MAG: sigma-70 family RNA polymerase sigma factor [Planctomycetota bacterium]